MLPALLGIHLLLLIENFVPSGARLIDGRSDGTRRLQRRMVRRRGLEEIFQQGRFYGRDAQKELYDRGRTWSAAGSRYGEFERAGARQPRPVREAGYNLTVEDNAVDVLDGAVAAALEQQCGPISTTRRWTRTRVIGGNIAHNTAVVNFSVLSSIAMPKVAVLDGVIASQIKYWPPDVRRKTLDSDVLFQMLSEQRGAGNLPGLRRLYLGPLRFSESVKIMDQILRELDFIHYVSVDAAPSKLSDGDEDEGEGQLEIIVPQSAFTWSLTSKDVISQAHGTDRTLRRMPAQRMADYFYMLSGIAEVSAVWQMLAQHQLQFQTIIEAIHVTLSKRVEDDPIRSPEQDGKIPQYDIVLSLVLGRGNEKANYRQRDIEPHWNDDEEEEEDGSSTLDYSASTGSLTAASIANRGVDRSGSSNSQYEIPRTLNEIFRGVPLPTKAGVEERQSGLRLIRLARMIQNLLLKFTGRSKSQPQRLERSSMNEPRRTQLSDQSALQTKESPVDNLHKFDPQQLPGQASHEAFPKSEIKNPFIIPPSIGSSSETSRKSGESPDVDKDTERDRYVVDSLTTPLQIGRRLSRQHYSDLMSTAMGRRNFGTVRSASMLNSASSSDVTSQQENRSQTNPLKLGRVLSDQYLLRQRIAESKTETEKQQDLQRNREGS